MKLSMIASSQHLLNASSYRLSILKNPMLEAVKHHAESILEVTIERQRTIMVLRIYPANRIALSIHGASITHLFY